MGPATKTATPEALKQDLPYVVQLLRGMARVPELAEYATPLADFFEETLASPVYLGMLSRELGGK